MEPEVTVPTYDPRCWAVELIQQANQQPDMHMRYEASAEVAHAFASLVETLFRAHDGRPDPNSVIMAFSGMWSVGYDAGYAAAKAEAQP